MDAGVEKWRGRSENGSTISEVRSRHARRYIAVLGLALCMWSKAYADSIDVAVTTIADHIGKTLVAKGKSKVTVLDFTDLNGKPVELGRYVAEQLSVELVGNPGLAVMDRANLKSILAEHKLSEEGLVNPDTAKKLGQFGGVEIIVTGTLTTGDGKVLILAKGIATDTAEICAAARTTALLQNPTPLQQPGRSAAQSSSPQSVLSATNVGPSEPNAPPLPPPVEDAVVTRPGPDFIWIPGFWAEDNGTYHWVRGHWERPPHGYRIWVQPRWEMQNGQYILIRGHWRK